jgi:hypothetical protein
MAGFAHLTHQGEFVAERLQSKYDGSMLYFDHGMIKCVKIPLSPAYKKRRENIY